ncbi:MAG: hypothetical protein P8Z67_13625 [Gammaproteobacteria bacterium]
MKNRAKIIATIGPASQDKDSYTNKLLAMMRNAFGGHQVKDS